MNVPRVYPHKEWAWPMPAGRWVVLDCPACGAEVATLVGRGYTPRGEALGMPYECATTRLPCCWLWVEVVDPPEEIETVRIEAHQEDWHRRWRGRSVEVARGRADVLRTTGHGE